MSLRMIVSPTADAAGKELLLDVAAEESHAPAGFLVAPVVEPARLHADGTNFGKGRVGAGHAGRGIVVKAAHIRAAALEFRQNVAAGGGFLLNGGDVTRVPASSPGRPARPPACMLVRPSKKIIKSLPKVSCCLCWPTRKPSPAATIRVMEMMPQAIPNMVRKVRSLCAHKVRRVSRRRSVKTIVGPLAIALSFAIGDCHWY